MSGQDANEPDHGILDLNVEDLDDPTASDGTLDVVLGDEPATRVTSSARPAHSSDTTGEETQPALDVPMVNGGVCSRCGFALRPLEDVCPRCRGTVVQAASAQPQALPTDQPPPGLAATGQFPEVSSSAAGGERRGCRLATLLPMGALVALVGVAGWSVWMSPSLRARRAYQEGLKLQLSGDSAGARGKYRQALDLDPAMGLAAFSIGTTYLGMGSADTARAMGELTQRAVSGQTAELDEADRWFRYAMEIARRLPANAHLMDERISTPLRLEAFSRACLATTALIRYSAAVQADDLDAAAGWLRVAGEEAQQALRSDPDNSAAQQILGQIGPRL
jgi:hypothetical protein